MHALKVCTTGRLSLAILYQQYQGLFQREEGAFAPPPLLGNWLFFNTELPPLEFCLYAFDTRE